MTIDDIPGVQDEVDLPLVDVSLAYPEPVSGSKSFSKWFDCALCGLRFKEADITVFRGKRYGNPCGCSKDITTLLNKG